MPSKPDLDRVHSVCRRTVSVRVGLLVLVAQASFPNAGPGEGMDVVPVLRPIRSVAPQHAEAGQRIEIARMQQLLAKRG